MGLVRDYNGVDIEQYSDAISISAEAYIERLLKTHGWDKPSSKETGSNQPGKPTAPLPTDCLHSMYSEQGPREGTIEHTVLEKKHKFSYRTLLGELMYAYITARPDIGYAITTLSKFSSSPADCHYIYLKGVAKYLRRTKHWGIKFTRPKSQQLKDLPKYPYDSPDPLADSLNKFVFEVTKATLSAFVDAAHANDPRKRRSTTGYSLMYAGGAVVYKSKTQTLTACSSTEAEFIAAYDVAKAVRYIRSILKDLKFADEGPTKIFIDNESALKIINDNQAPTARTRHMDIRFFALQDWKLDGDIEMSHIPGILNPTDDLTKPLGWILHSRHCRRTMGHFD